MAEYKVYRTGDPRIPITEFVLPLSAAGASALELLFTKTLNDDVAVRNSFAALRKEVN